MVYEAVLLFGVLFAAELLFLVATQSFNPSALHFWENLYLFVILGIYFTYFWGHGGQTLPMQTWHIKVVSKDAQRVTLKQSCIRYVAAWMWLLPALAIIEFLKPGLWPGIALFIAGMVGWALTSRFDENGQFLHDKLAGTQVVSVPKPNRISDTE